MSRGRAPGFDPARRNNHRWFRLGQHSSLTCTQFEYQPADATCKRSRRPWYPVLFPDTLVVHASGARLLLVRREGNRNGVAWFQARVRNLRFFCNQSFTGHDRR